MEIIMRLGLIVSLTLVLLAAACQGPPPTTIVMVVTATPEQTTEPQSVNTAESQPPTSSLTPIPPSPLPAMTATPNLFPTPTLGQIQVAEQQFEHGRMFWIQPRKQIWVMYDDGSGSGKWEVY